jgi:hypothetical protein
LRKAIAFRSRRLAASESSQLASVLVGRELRQIMAGGLQPAMVLLSHSRKHILVRAMEAGRYEIWRSLMIILDLLIELGMSVIMLIIEGVGLDRGFTRGLMHTVGRQRGGLF